MATGVVLAIAVTTFAAMASQVMTSWAKAYARDDVRRLPQVEVALVLGTLIHDYPNHLNPGLRHRLEAAVELWRAGRVRYLIVSGSRDGQGYDEPTAMRDELVARGVPADIIYRDFAGNRTLASIVRARDIYGQRRFIVVSQNDHLGRALFLARHLGIDAWGYDAVGRVPFMVLETFYSKLRVLYGYWDLVAGPRAAVGPRVVIGVDPPA